MDIAMLSVVCWRWGTRYGVHFVNRLRSMLARHLRLDHQLFCITDDPEGLDAEITPIPIWPSEYGRCRRLQVFDPQLKSVFGERILHLDIDCILTSDITPMVDRDEPFVIWRSVPAKKYNKSTGELKDNGENGIGPYNTSMMLMDTGVFPTLWQDYRADPKGLEREAKKAGFGCLLHKTTDITRVMPLETGDDDQAIVSLYAKRLLDPPVWLERDGIYKCGRRGFEDKSKLPENARIVFFNGSITENNQENGQEIPWIKEHWC